MTALHITCLILAIPCFLKGMQSGYDMSVSHNIECNLALIIAAQLILVGVFGLAGILS